MYTSSRGLFDKDLFEVHPNLKGAYYIPNLFPHQLLDQLKNLRDKTPGDSCSVNMYATRHRFYSREIASALFSYLPPELGYTRILGDLRFIHYPLGGYIAPHVDGVCVDAETLEKSTTSMLLYLSDTEEGEGETEFLVALDSEDVIATVRPTYGSVLVFPHRLPHQGQCVGASGKFLLRADLY